MSTLIVKHQTVLDLLLADPQRNMAKAYQAVYKCTDKTADERGSKLSKNVKFATALQLRLDELSEKVMVKAEDIVRELKALGFSNMRNYVDFGPVGVTLKEMSEMTDEQTAAIQEVSHNLGPLGGGSVKFKLHDKRGPLVDLGKNLGMFKDDADGTGERPVFVGININLGDKK